MTPKKHDPQASTLKASHVCVNGKVLVFDEPPPDIAAFVDQVRAAASSKKVSLDGLIAMIYGSDNPLLSKTMLPGYSMVTPEVFENPVYRVLLDLLDRKRVQLGQLDPVKAAARYTLSIPEAAEKMGVHRNAIVNAIDTGKLPVWIKGDRYYLDPATLHAYEPEKRGASPRLQIRFGNAPGMSFRFKAPTELDDLTKVDEHVKEGVLAKWKRIAVITGEPKENKFRFYVLEPASTQDHLKHGPFGVEGRFRVVEKTNNAVDAQAAWKKFEPA
jgi:excisionase family DNA binding protein